MTGFSITTVSKALNNYSDVSEKTKAKIVQAAAEMGYLPNAHAQSLSTKRSWTIGVMFSEAHGVGMMHPFFNAIIESFRKATEQQGYDLIFASRNLRNRDMSYLEHFRHRAVDGIVVICSDQMDQHVQELIQSTIPIVVVDMAVPIVVSSTRINIPVARSPSIICTNSVIGLIAHIAGRYVDRCGKSAD